MTLEGRRHVALRLTPETMDAMAVTLSLRRLMRISDLLNTALNDQLRAGREPGASGAPMYSTQARWTLVKAVADWLDQELARCLAEPPEPAPPPA